MQPPGAARSRGIGPSSHAPPQAAALHNGGQPLPAEATEDELRARIAALDGEKVALLEANEALQTQVDRLEDEIAELEGRSQITKHCGGSSTPSSPISMLCSESNISRSRYGWRSRSLPPGCVNERRIVPGIDLGAGPTNGGCSAPIGRCRSRQAEPALRRYRAPSATMQLLAAIRSQLHNGLAGIGLTLRQIESDVARNADTLAELTEVIAHLRVRLTQVEHHLGLVETPEAPRINRRRPLQ
jgi:hypothetical protein